MTTELPWHADRSNLIRMAEWLVDEEGFNAKQLLYFLEKPWKWTPEWEALNAKTELFPGTTDALDALTIRPLVAVAAEGEPTVLMTEDEFEQLRKDATEYMDTSGMAFAEIGGEG